MPIITHRLNRRLPQRTATLASITGLALLAIVALFIAFYQIENVESAAGDLTVRIVAADNLVVDSNVLSPSTYAPSVATVMGEICNNTVSPMSNVQAFIGDDPDNNRTTNDGTPGIYPARGPNIVEAPTFATQHPDLAADTPGTAPGDEYYFVHVGGTLGAKDATRLIGTIPANTCVYQYWHFTYPRRSNSAADNDNLGNVPTWGGSVKADDDLWLEFDVWATNGAGDNDSGTLDTHRMYMRNEISAMANKIRPNPDGSWFNTNTSIVKVGQPITSNGILYELGNINQGFDNPSGDFYDGIPDYNAWMQPVGDPAYDPSCFRLIRTSGVLTVSRSGGNPDLIIDFDDTGSYISGVPQPQYAGPLYFTNLPSNNNGVRGKVFYTFVPMQSNCTTALSPYQEVASGSDNEKFNGDYGTGIAPLQSLPPSVTFVKTAPASTINEGQTLTSYSITIDNPTGGASEPFGLSFTVGTGTATAYGVIEDTVPEGVQYASGSAAFSSTPAGLTATIFYSTDGGSTWSTTDPAGNPTSTAANPIVIQWRLNGVLAVGQSATGLFNAVVPVGYGAGGGSPLIENCAGLSISGGTAFDESCDTTLVNGPYSIGDFVWRDLDNDGQQDGGLETGIDNVTVNLYFDANGDGILDANDPLIKTTSTASGTYNFTNLPGADYIVAVDTDSAGIPAGYKETTPVTVSVLDLGTTPNTSPFIDADFGFGPSLSLVKQNPTPNPIYEGDLVSYNIVVTNNRPGNGGGGGSCQFTGYGQVLDNDYTQTTPAGKAWTPYTAVPGNPDNVYASSEFANTNEDVAVHTFNIGTSTGSPTSMTYLLPIDVVGVGDFRNPQDQLIVYLYDNNGTAGTGDDTLLDTRTIDGSVLVTFGDAPFTLEIPVPGSALATLSMADFTNGNVSVEVSADGGGGSFAGYINMDAIGLRLENGLTCNDPDDIIEPLPLVDTYEANKLQFVSATVSPTFKTVVGSAGTLTWNNVGPLDPGDTRTITVVFRALQPAGNLATTTQNCADSPGGSFPDGSATNDPAQNCKTVPHNPTAEIGDTVWVNNVTVDGIVNPGEVGIPNVTVRLCLTSACATVLQTTTTDANGNYLFTGVRNGTYAVVVTNSTLPAGFVYNFERNDGTPENTTNVTVAGAAVTNINGTACTNCNLNVDFGVTIPYALYGKVWEDINGNGVQNTGEDNIAGVRVYLSDGVCGYPAGAPICASVLTNASGNYAFYNLTGGVTYQAVVYSGNFNPGQPLENYTQTGDPDIGGACGACDNQMTTGQTMVGNPLLRGSYDFGYRRTGSLTLGDYVYRDWNHNGDVDMGEDGINGVTVRLYEDDNNNGIVDSGDALIATTVTVNGFYQFTGLPDGAYVVVVDGSGIPATYSQTDDPDVDGTVCSFVSSSNCDGRGSTPDLAGSSNDTYDFGYWPKGTGSIGDLVWRDDNADGNPDAWEPGLPNIQVCLYHDRDANGTYESADDALIGCKDTDANGNYEFTGLALGEDYVVVVNDADSDLPTRGGEPYAPSTPIVHPVSNLGTTDPSPYLDADFGFFPAGIIGDYVFEDTDADGNQDGGEPGIPNIEVNLYTCDNATCTTLTFVTTTSTDANGYYEFTGLGPNEYVVVVNTADPDFPAGWTQSSDPDETGVCSVCDSQSEVYDPSTTLFGLGVGQIDRSRDFGYIPTGRIGNTVWINSDGDSIKDSFEKGIAEITVNLYSTLDCTGPVTETTTTDDQGEYAFGGLADGDYCVEVVTADPDWPSDVSTTSNYEPDASVNSRTPVVMSGGVVTDMGDDTSCTGCDFDADFGYPLNGTNSVSGTIFYDLGDNGDPFTVGDIPFAGIIVRIFDSSGTQVGAVATNASGFYEFTGLPDGVYTIAVDDTSSLLSEYTQNYDPNLGGSGKCGVCDNQYQTISLTGPGDSETNLDFGYFGADPSPTAIRLSGLALPEDPTANVVVAGLLLLTLVSAALWLRQRRHNWRPLQ